MAKSPVDDLVDGLDAIGSIIDENIPAIKERLSELAESQKLSGNDLSLLKKSYVETTESLAELRKTDINMDVKLEEISATIGALTRRLDQIQKSILDLNEAINHLAFDNELADAVKVLEDKLKRVESGRGEGPGTNRRF